MRNKNDAIFYKSLFYHFDSRYNTKTNFIIFDSNLSKKRNHDLKMKQSQRILLLKSRKTIKNQCSLYNRMFFRLKQCLWRGQRPHEIWFYSGTNFHNVAKKCIFLTIIWQLSDKNVNITNSNNLIALWRHFFMEELCWCSAYS